MSNENMFKKWYWKRFSRKYDKYIPFEMPTHNASVAESHGVLKQMKPFKRHFPLFGYKWRAAKKSLLEGLNQRSYKDRGPVIKNLYKRWYRQRFNRKYTKHMIAVIPDIHAGIDDGPGPREQMKPYRRSFPLWGYRWRKAEAESESESESKKK